MLLIEEIVELGYEHDRLIDAGRREEAEEVYRELQKLRHLLQQEERRAYQNRRLNGKRS